MNNFVKKSMVLKNLGAEKIIIIDPEDEYKQLVKILGSNGRLMTIHPNPCTALNPFEINDCNENREECMSNLKKLLSQYYKFVKESNGQKLDFNEIKELCERNNFEISDEELLDIIRECKECKE